jgi:hypothetical protein
MGRCECAEPLLVRCQGVNSIGPKRARAPTTCFGRWQPPHGYRHTSQVGKAVSIGGSCKEHSSNGLYSV